METIRQTCPECRSVLELPASAIGRLARCPACQHTFRVPGEAPTSGEPGSVSPSAPQSPSASGFGNAGFAPSKLPSDAATAPSKAPAANPNFNPYADPSPASSYNPANPYALTPGMVSTAALQVEQGEIQIRKASIDEIVSASTAIFSARWQPMVLSGLLYFVLALLIGILSFAVNIFVVQTLDLGAFILFGFSLVTNLFTWYLALGLMNVGLMAARGQETGPAKMFVAPNVLARLVIPIFVLSLFAAIPALLPLLMQQAEDEFLVAMLSLGGFFIVAALSGLFLWTVWPMFLLVLDNRSEVDGALSTGFKIGTTNLLNGFLLGLISMVLGIAGALTCSLGTIVTQPLMMMILAVAYLFMTAQPVSNPNATPYQAPNYPVS